MTAGRGPRTFDPDVIGNAETDAWASYYRREWWPFLKAAVGMVREGFGMGRLRTLQGAYYVLRANQKWAPYPDNDPEAARDHMRRFYALVSEEGTCAWTRQRGCGARGRLVAAAPGTPVRRDRCGRAPGRLARCPLLLRVRRATRLGA